MDHSSSAPRRASPLRSPMSFRPGCVGEVLLFVSRLRVVRAPSGRSSPRGHSMSDENVPLCLGSPLTALLPHPGTVAALPLFTLTTPAAASPIDKEGSRHCHRPSAVRQCASYLVRLSAHITKRNQCTVQVIACPKDALIHLSTSREFPSGPQAIDCNRRLLQHDDGGSFVTAGIPHGGGSLRGSTRCRHLDP